ncbi:MAG TPA: transporter substrate-binding domain-containing protein, partial [Candidatus Udaeobacter sp.]|nr:transporter substrate-binding domain-containing protein [Candidatus Udaeobacter sp.]
MRKHVLGGILLGAMIALAGVAAHADDVIKFGVAAEPYPPFSSKDASGTWVGFEIDLMHAVCDQMKANCVLVETAWDGIIPALQEKKIDVIWSSMSITEERKQKIDFTDRYYKTPAIIIGAKSESVNIDFSNP